LSLKTALQFLGVFVVAIVLALLGAAAGWIVGGGMFNKGFNYFTLIGGGSGMVLGAFVGYFTIGPGRQNLWHIVKKNMPPDRTRLSYGLGNTTFSLHMTIHEVRNVASSDGILAWFGKGTDSYAEVRVGRKLHKKDNFTPNILNPVKRTCVEQKGRFEEEFKLVIRPTDDTLEVRLMDQDIAADDTVGTAYIDISKDIIAHGFPQQKGYFLMQKDSILWGGTLRRTGTILISFNPGDDLPDDLIEDLQEKHPEEFERYRRRISNTAQQMQQEEKTPLVGGDSLKVARASRASIGNYGAVQQPVFAN